MRPKHPYEVLERQIAEGTTIDDPMLFNQRLTITQKHELFHRDPMLCFRYTGKSQSYPVVGSMRSTVGAFVWQERFVAGGYAGSHRWVSMQELTQRPFVFIWADDNIAVLWKD